MDFELISKEWLVGQWNTSANAFGKIIVFPEQIGKDNLL